MTPEILIHGINGQYSDINIGLTSKLVFKYQKLTSKF